MKMKSVRLLLAVCGLVGALDVFAGRVTGLSSVPGWFPSSSSYHFHAKAAWYDARADKNRIGLTINETPGYTYYYNYNPASQISISQAAAIYSTLLAAVSTRMEISMAITDTSTACADCYRYEVIQLGPQ